MLKEVYPIAIVGGGMAGASLALALASQGIESVVLEAFEIKAQTHPSFDDRTVALSAFSLDILEAIGLKDSISSRAHPIKNIHISDKGNLGFARLKAEEFKREKVGAVIENWQLGQALHQAIKHEESIDFLSSATVIGIKQDASKVEIEYAHQDKKQRLEAQLLILADGNASPLKKLLNIETDCKDFSKNAIVCNIKTQLAHKDWAFERFTEDGPLAYLPLSDNRISVVWSQTIKNSQALIKMSDKDFAKALEEHFSSRLGKITKVGQRNIFPLKQHQAETLCRGRCLLIGNSAQTLHPIAGQGFNLALRDVAILVETLKLSAGDYGEYSLLRAYQSKREQDRKQTLLITESLARLFNHRFAPLSLCRNFLLKGLDILPAAKGQLGMQAMGYKGLEVQWMFNEK